MRNVDALRIINDLYLTRCVCETQMSPIMTNSKDGLGHKDKYIDTSRKSPEMLMSNMKALILII